MVADEQTERGVLWVVATPIGTLGDFSPRAAEVLERVSLVLAEDTRRTRRLLAGLGLEISAPLRSLHDHNEDEAVPGALASLERGKDVALVSDAGTPVLSDPGFQLVRRVREEGIRVASVPGPSAFTAALAVSGQPPLPAVLVGFLPPKKGRRTEALSAVIMHQATTVFFLSPHRLGDEIRDIRDVLGPDRSATLLAELSKRYERAVRGTLAELAEAAEIGGPRGEYVLVVGPPPGGERTRGKPGPHEARKAYERALDLEGDRKEALKAAARFLGIGRRELYALLLENQDF